MKIKEINRIEKKNSIGRKGRFLQLRVAITELSPDKTMEIETDSDEEKTAMIHSLYYFKKKFPHFELWDKDNKVYVNRIAEKNGL
jgi:hypothetical protein